MTLGSIEYLIEGESFSRLYRGLSNSDLPFSDMKESEGRVTMRVSFEYSRQFEAMCREEGYEPERIGRHGMLRIYKKLLARPGLIVGALLSALLMYYYSNVILTITVDTDDPEIRGKVMDVLTSDGVKPGAYLPDIDLVLEERSLKRQIDDISWAGISRTGSGIAVDIIENIVPEKGIQAGMPCHLVACEDGVIEEIELLDGQLMKCIGSGVTKGEIVVSGKIVTETSKWTDKGEEITTKTRYTRSIGKIRGTFERTVVFEQPFDSEVKAHTGDTETLRYLDIFSAKIPLFHDIPDGWYETESEERHYPEIGGFMLPMGITEIHLGEFDSRSQLYSEDEAFALAEKSAYRYEQNFLGAYEIKDRQCKKDTAKDGVRLTVTYTLYGDLCRETDFFMPRIIIPDEDTKEEENVQVSENN